MEAEIVKLALSVSRRCDHIRGPDTAPATLLEYGDYECPFYGQVYTIIKQLQKALAKNLRFASSSCGSFERNNYFYRRRLKRFFRRGSLRIMV